MKRKLGSMVTLHPDGTYETTDDPLYLAETHLADLVRWVHERGLLVRCPKGFLQNPPRELSVAVRVRNPGSKFHGQTIRQLKPELIVLWHKGIFYRERTEPPLPPLERRMVQQLCHAESDLAAYARHYRAGDIQQAALCAWELGRDLLTVRAALEFDADVARAIRCRVSGKAGNITKRREAAKRRAQHRDFIVKALMRPAPFRPSYARAVKDAVKWFDDPERTIRRNTADLNRNRRP